MNAKVIAQKIVDGIEPEITTDEIKFLATEHLRLLQQAKPGEDDIKLPDDIKALRKAVEGFDD